LENLFIIDEKLVEIIQAFARDYSIDRKSPGELKDLEVNEDTLLPGREVFMVEAGELVGLTATVDPRNEEVHQIEASKVPLKDG
jgi:hypothetical protein